MKLVENFLNKAKWYDIQLVKLAVFFFTLMLITLSQSFLQFVLRFEWYIYLILLILVMIPLLKKVLS